MRGLPPPPPDVCRITATWDVNGVEVQTGWWLFAPGSDGATDAQLNTLLGDFYLSPAGDLLPRLSTDTSLAELECVSSPRNGLTVRIQPAPNLGALDGTTALNAAMVLTWNTGQRRIGAHTHSWLPLSRSNLGADKRRLSPLGYAEAVAAAQRFVAHCDALVSPDGATCVLVALHRQFEGTPLGASLMLPVLFGSASPIVGTLQRRAATAPRAPSRL